MIRVEPSDPDYPARLRDLTHPPDPLWIDGDETALIARSVAIVGTRRMTGYGERVAREIAGWCAAAKVVVVSGFAQGIDSAAHRGALDGGGRTIAVLGEGITLFLATVRGRRLSARGFHRVLRVARTIGDLAASDEIRTSDLAFALMLRAQA